MNKASTSKGHILIVEDFEDEIFGYRKYLGNLGYSTSAAGNVKEARELLGRESFSIALLDLELPDGNGMEILSHLKKLNPIPGSIMITGTGGVSEAVSAMKQGAFNFLTKPVNLDELMMNIEKCLQLNHLEKKQAVDSQLKDRKSIFFGESNKIKEMLKLAKIAAMKDTAILLTGETGTGKSALAKWIHTNSPRSGGPMVELNCSTLKGGLLRSELFGYVKGAFTSAVKDRMGLIESADGGTLFLDEIGEMDLDAQSQLLKAIEEHSFRRVGENIIRFSNFKLLCATNSDLQESVKTGAFRKDLYYRICVFPIELVSLRERKDDIVPMAKYLLTHLGYSDKSLSAEVQELLVNQEWKGNVRELRNALERAALISQTMPISPEHFPSTNFHTAPDVFDGAPSTRTWSLEEQEKRLIIEAYTHYKQNKVKMCAALGISMASLYRKLEKFKSELP